jgi:hypothetical protein
MIDPNNPGSVNAGSPNVPASKPGQVAPAGQTNNGGANDTSKSYTDLEKRFGEQGQELGEYRTFFQNISPLLEKLDNAPELVQALVDGKIDQSMAKAVLEGRVTVGDAKVATEAHKEVKEELGKKGYEATDPDKINKMVEDRINELRKDLDEKSELKNFEAYTQQFIENTPDFEEYAQEIDKWLDAHDVTDIEVAYYAVKGHQSVTKAQKQAEQEANERAKNMVANASGGGVHAQFSSDGTPLVDQLIQGRPNPNSIF